MRDTLLDVREIEKQYERVKAVDRVSFGVRRGEIFALLGPNGAGKTTTIRMLVGIIRPDRGTIDFSIAGDRIAQPGPGQIGYLPEDRGLYREVPVIKTLTYFGVLRGMSRGDARRAAQTWLDRLDLKERASDKLDALSKGNQQKVQFISAILHTPAFAVLDEPFSGLDPVNQDMFLDLLRELREAGTTILLSAHQMQLVERIADRILVMQSGREVLCGTLRELRERARSGQRLVLRLDGSPDLAPLEEHPLVEGVERLDDGEVAVRVRDRAPLGDVLVTIGSRFEVLDVRSETLSLHDIYVQAVGQTGVDAGEVPV